MVKNPLSYAGDMGLIPSQGTKIPHATEELNQTLQLESSRVTTTESARSRAHALQVKQAHHNWRKFTHHSKGPAELKRTKTHKTDDKPETQECGHCRG